jgi:hypothetical protein
VVDFDGREGIVMHAHDVFALKKSSGTDVCALIPNLCAGAIGGGGNGGVSVSSTDDLCFALLNRFIIFLSPTASECRPIPERRLL